MNEQIFVDRTTTWHAIGKDVNECKDMESVLKKSGLDYEVEKRPVYFNDQHITLDKWNPVPNRYVTVRKTDDHPYDIVSDKFEVIQNREAFDFVKYMGADLSFEKAGETGSGMVYVIGKLPEVDVLGDAFVPHVLFRNGFDGKTKITAAICPLRLVCQNQFNFAFEDAQNKITVRHVQNAEAKLEDAKEVLKMSADYMAKITDIAAHFASIKMTDDRLERVLDILFPMPKDVKLNPFKQVTLESARDAFLHAHNADDNQNFKGTAWGLINAYTDYITHKTPAGNREDRFEGKFINTTFKISMNPIINAIEAAC